MAIANLPYEHALGDGGPRSTTQVVVIHATDNTASAANEAGYATRRADKTSAHFYVDGGSAYRALPLGNIAYGCLWHGNQISVQLELCGLSNQISDATMRQAAPIVAEVCAMYGIPVRKLTAAQVAGGAKGICGHADITAAFPQDHGDHTDPGASFPWSTFLSYVSAGGGGGGFLMALSDDEQRRILDTVTAIGQGLPNVPGSANALFQWEMTRNKQAGDAAAALKAIQDTVAAGPTITLTTEQVQAIGQLLAAALPGALAAALQSLTFKAE